MLPKNQLGLILLALCAAGELRSQVVLNEIMANNESAVAHGTGFPDYVELLNRSAQSANLSGWSLTDDPALPRRYVFPEVTLDAGERLVVWCATLATGTGLYSGFGLGARGDQVLLFDNQGGVPVDSVTFGLQSEDLSLGRIPEGTGAWILTKPTPVAANEGQTTAATPILRINEWMARPAVGEDWLEVYNADDLPAALSGFVLTDGNNVPPSNRAIPELSFIAARGFVQFLASDLEEPGADHLDFRLGAGGETLSLFATDRTTVIDRITFGSQIDNSSQGRVPDGGDNLAFFSAGEETPGQPNAANDIRVVINEVLSHADPPLEDAIELHNPTIEPVDISHWWLSDSLVEPRKYRIPGGRIIAPGGFAVFYNQQFGNGTSGFSLNSYEGDRVVLSAGDANGELTGPQTTVRFGALKNGVSVGRFVTSTGVDWAPLERRTFGVDDPSSLPHFRTGTGLSNAPARIGSVVVNELHFQPAASNPEDEFVEVHNPTLTAVNLFDPESPTNTSRFRDGIMFDLPFNVIIPPGGFAVIVGFDPLSGNQAQEFRLRHNVPAGVPILGPFSGRLSDTGEVIELQHPDAPEGPDDPNAGFVPYEILERVEYSPISPWPTGVLGSSLQRADAKAYGNDPLNWFTATPTPGRPSQAAPIDSDGDGMPDVWEQDHGLNSSNPDDANEDADDDQFKNLDEYHAGTDARDPTSRFWVMSSLAESEITMSFYSVAGKSYSALFSPTASSGSWTTITNISATDVTGTRTFAVSVPDFGHGFLRLTTP